MFLTTTALQQLDHAPPSIPFLCTTTASLTHHHTFSLYLHFLQRRATQSDSAGVPLIYTEKHLLNIDKIHKKTPTENPKAPPSHAPTPYQPPPLPSTFPGDTPTTSRNPGLAHSYGGNPHSIHHHPPKTQKGPIHNQRLYC